MARIPLLSSTMSLATLFVLVHCFLQADVTAEYIEIRSSVIKISRSDDSEELLNHLPNTEESQELDVSKIKALLEALHRSNRACECAHDNCGCCANLDIKKVKLHDKVCINVSYIPAQLAISVTVSIGNKVLYNKTISAHNPPDICFGIPGVKKYAEICIQFYNLETSSKNFHGCVKLEAKLYHVKVEDFDFGCFDIPLMDVPLTPLVKANHL